MKKVAPNSNSRSRTPTTPPQGCQAPASVLRGEQEKLRPEYEKLVKNTADSNKRKRLEGDTLTQRSIESSLCGDITAVINTALISWLASCGLTFNMANMPSFKNVVRLIGLAGGAYKCERVPFTHVNSTHRSHGLNSGRRADLKSMLHSMSVATQTVALCSRKPNKTQTRPWEFWEYPAVKTAAPTLAPLAARLCAGYASQSAAEWCNKFLNNQLTAVRNQMSNETLEKVLKLQSYERMQDSHKLLAEGDDEPKHIIDLVREGTEARRAAKAAEAEARAAATEEDYAMGVFDEEVDMDELELEAFFLEMDGCS